MTELQVGFQEDVSDLDQGSSLLESKTALPVKEGYLIKRGETVKSWKRRWFQLRGGQLYYYKERGDVLLGTISLNDSDVGHMDYVNKQNCFAIKTTKRIFYCIADTTTDATEWIDCIVKHGTNARLVPEGIRVTQTIRAVKMGKRGIEVTTSPIGRIKTSLRASTLKDPASSASSPHTFHRKFVNGLVKCSTCKGQLKKQCYLCQVCRCCIHPRCFKDTPTNCYSRGDFNLEERPISPRIEFVVSDQPRLVDVRADRAKNPGRRLPERISQRVRESGVYRHEDYPVQAPPPDMEEDYQLTNDDPEFDTSATLSEPPKIFGAVKVGVVFNPADLSRRLATTGNKLNHRGSIVSGDFEGASLRPGQDEVPQAVVPRGPPIAARSKKPAAPGLRATRSVPEGQIHAVTSSCGEFQQSPVNTAMHMSADLSDQGQSASPRSNSKLGFLDQFDFINTPLSIEEEENPEAVVPTSLRRDSASTSPRTERAKPPPAKRPTKALPPTRGAKKSLTEAREAAAYRQATEVVISPPQTPPIEVVAPVTSSHPKRTSKVTIPEFPVEYMTRELPPIDPSRRTKSTEKKAELPVVEKIVEEPIVEEPKYDYYSEPEPIESISEEESSSSSSSSSEESIEVETPVEPVMTPIEAVAPLSPVLLARAKSSPKMPGPAKKGAMRPKGAVTTQPPKTPSVPTAVPTPVVAPQQIIVPTPVVAPPTAVVKQPQVAPEPSEEVKPVVAGSPKPKQPASVPKGKGPGPKVGAPGPKQPPTVAPVKQNVVEQPEVTAEEVSPPQSPKLPAAVPPKQTIATSAIKRPAPPGAKRGLMSSGQNTVTDVRKSGEFESVGKAQEVSESPRTVVPPPEPAANKPAVSAKTQAKGPPEQSTPPAAKPQAKGSPEHKIPPAAKPQAKGPSQQSAPPAKKSGPKVPPAKKGFKPKEPAPRPVETSVAPSAVGTSDEFDSWANDPAIIPVEPEPIIVETPVTMDDIVVNSDHKPAVRAVRKASMTRRAVDFPQTKHEKPVEVRPEPVFDDWGADLGVVEEIQEAKDLIEDDFADTFTDFDNLDDVMSALNTDTSDLDVLIKDSKYGAWDVDDSSSARSSATVTKNVAPKSNNNVQPVEYEYYEEEQPASGATEEYGDYEAW